MRLAVRRLRDDARLPTRAHDDDAGLDLYAVEGVTIGPGERALVATGVAIELPERHAGLVVPRSGLAVRHGISVVNAPGLIDPGYRGEIKVILLNLGQEPYHVQPGDRIAQMVVARYEAVDWEEGELNGSARGTGGFGSSGR